MKLNTDMTSIDNSNIINYTITKCQKLKFEKKNNTVIS